MINGSPGLPHGWVGVPGAFDFTIFPLIMVPIAAVLDSPDHPPNDLPHDTRFVHIAR